MKNDLETVHEFMVSYHFGSDLRQVVEELQILLAAIDEK